MNPDFTQFTNQDLPTMFDNNGPWIPVSGFVTAVPALVATTIVDVTIPSYLDVYFRGFTHTSDSVALSGTKIDIFADSTRIWPYSQSEEPVWNPAGTRSENNAMQFVFGKNQFLTLVDRIVRSGSNLRYVVTYPIIASADVLLWFCRRDTTLLTKAAQA